MLSDQEWREIRTYANEVVNRKGNSVVGRGLYITRDAWDNIIIRLDAMVLDLEPEQELGTTRQERLTDGPGWPD